MYRLRAKRTTGSNPPAELLFGELAYSDANQRFYVGRADGSPATFETGSGSGSGADLTPINEAIAAIEAEQGTQNTAIANLATSDEAQETALSALNSTTSAQGEALATLTTNTQAALDLKLEAGAIANFETTTQLNARDIGNRNRASHTGTQAAATIADFTAAAAAAAPVQSVAGRAGAVVLAKADVGLGNVDNTSDAAKPISTATQAALDLKAALSSIPPCLLGHAQFLPYPVTLSGGLYTDPYGWLWYAPNGGSIGSAASGSTVANAKIQALYAALWAHLGLATAGWSIQTSTGGASTVGASAAADWAANKRLIVPDQRGRTILAAGQGSGLSNRAVGVQGGAETHALGSAENGAHNHAITITRTNRAGSANEAYGNHIDTNSSSFVATQAWEMANSGSGTPHNNMQPFSAYSLLWFTGEKA